MPKDQSIGRISAHLRSFEGDSLLFDRSCQRERALKQRAAKSVGLLRSLTHQKQKLIHEHRSYITDIRTVVEWLNYTTNEEPLYLSLPHLNMINCSFLKVLLIKKVL